MARRPIPSPDDVPRYADALLSGPQVAALLGCSVATAYDRMKGMPRVVDGGLVRVRRREVEAWIRAREVAPAGVARRPARVGKRAGGAVRDGGTTIPITMPRTKPRSGPR